MTKPAEVEIRTEITVRLMLNSLKIQAFADPRHHQGDEKYSASEAIQRALKNSLASSKIPVVKVKTIHLAYP